MVLGKLDVSPEFAILLIASFTTLFEEKPMKRIVRFYCFAEIGTAWKFTLVSAKSDNEAWKKLAEYEKKFVRTVMHQYQFFKKLGEDLNHWIFRASKIRFIY